MKSHDELRVWAEEIRDKVEAAVAAGDDLADHFAGGVYGEDEAGRWITGFGVYGGAGHITVAPDAVRVCGVAAPFSPAAAAAMRELFEMAGRA